MSFVIASLCDVARRSVSIARLRATVVSHAPGLRGIPLFGQALSARANAS